MTKYEMVGWHHRLNGHECEQTQGDGEGRGSLMCCSPWGHKESEHDLAIEKQQNRWKAYRFYFSGEFLLIQPEQRKNVSENHVLIFCP